MDYALRDLSPYEEFYVFDYESYRENIRGIDEETSSML